MYKDKEHDNQSFNLNPWRMVFRFVCFFWIQLICSVLAHLNIHACKAHTHSLYLSSHLSNTLSLPLSTSLSFLYSLSLPLCLAMCSRHWRNAGNYRGPVVLAKSSGSFTPSFKDRLKSVCLQWKHCLPNQPKSCVELQTLQFEMPAWKWENSFEKDLLMQRYKV